VLQELINLAKDVRAARKRGEEDGLSQDEIAFYDALAENESALELLGNISLKIIAHELLVGLKGNISVDWSHRESARARMRVLVKRILRKHGYAEAASAKTKADAIFLIRLQKAMAMFGMAKVN
jgi:type I restriction enzyme R subunit